MLQIGSTDPSALNAGTTAGLLPRAAWTGTPTLGRDIRGDHPIPASLGGVPGHLTRDDRHVPIDPRLGDRPQRPPSLQPERAEISTRSAAVNLRRVLATSREPPQTKPFTRGRCLDRYDTATAELPHSVPRRLAGRFLFAVARWGQRNRKRRNSGSHLGTCEFLPAVARWDRNGTRVTLRSDVGPVTSRRLIRCREMGTAEHDDGGLRRGLGLFLFAVARWGQRNLEATYARTLDAVFLFGLARWGQRNERVDRRGRHPRRRVSIRCREMGTAEQF